MTTTQMKSRQFTLRSLFVLTALVAALLVFRQLTLTLLAIGLVCTILFSPLAQIVMVVAVFSEGTKSRSEISYAVISFLLSWLFIGLVFVEILDSFAATLAWLVLAVSLNSVALVTHWSSKSQPFLGTVRFGLAFAVAMGILLVRAFIEMNAPFFSR